MKQNVIIVLIVLITAASMRVYALSLGVYADGAAGRMFLADATWGREVHDNYSAGCGILLQTPLMRVDNAGYRLGLGFDRVFIPRTTRLASDYNDTYRVNLTNLLTYSFYNRKSISLWVGPQIAFSVISGSIHSTGNKHLRDLVFVPGFSTDEIAMILIKDTLSRNNSFMDYTLCLAPVVGIDYTASEYFTISADAGFRGGVHLIANDPGNRFRYEGFCELAVLLRITKDSVPDEK
jgi:hypothetical protein